MKPPIKNSLFFSVLGFLALSGAAHAAVLIDGTTRNGSFELPALAPLSKITTGFDVSGNDVPFWGNISTGTYDDSGVENGTGSNTGAQWAFFKFGEAGTFNLTTYAIQEGDQFTLTWFGRADNSTVDLFSSTSGDYSTAVTLVGSTQSNSSTYQQFTLDYTAVAADVGNTIGVSIFNPGSGYTNADDFVLTVTPVPEPSTSLSLAVGGIALLMLRSRRRFSRSPISSVALIEGLHPQAHS